MKIIKKKLSPRELGNVKVVESTNLLIDVTSGVYTVQN